MKVKIRHAESTDMDALTHMMATLWPEAAIEELRHELSTKLNGESMKTLPMAIQVAQDDDGSLIGFLEVQVRSHADGCDTTRPVGFVEGWFVSGSFRGRGIGRGLMGAAEEWARSHGCLEMASDALIDNDTSLAAHMAMGFEVVDRCVHFRKSL